MKHYNYILLNPTKPCKLTLTSYNISLLYEPYWVGLGQNDRKFEHFMPSRLDINKKRNQTDKVQYINNLINDGLSVEYLKSFVIIINENCTKQQSEELEKSIINEIGLCNLTNYKKGGYNGGKVGSALDGTVLFNLTTYQYETIFDVMSFDQMGPNRLRDLYGPSKYGIIRNNTYCLPESVEYLTEPVSFYHKYNSITLPRHQVDKFCATHKIIYSVLLDRKQRYSQGYYLYKEYFDEDYANPITIYHKNGDIVSLCKVEIQEYEKKYNITGLKYFFKENPSKSLKNTFFINPI